MSQIDQAFLRAYSRVDKSRVAPSTPKSAREELLSGDPTRRLWVDTPAAAATTPPQAMPQAQSPSAASLAAESPAAHPAEREVAGDSSRASLAQYRRQLHDRLTAAEASLTEAASPAAHEAAKGYRPVTRGWLRGQMRENTAITTTPTVAPESDSPVSQPLAAQPPIAQSPIAQSTVAQPPVARSQPASVQPQASAQSPVSYYPAKPAGPATALTGKDKLKARAAELLAAATAAGHFDRQWERGLKSFDPASWPADRTPSSQPSPVAYAQENEPAFSEHATVRGEQVSAPESGPDSVPEDDADSLASVRVASSLAGRWRPDDRHSGVPQAKVAPADLALPVEQFAAADRIDVGGAATLGQRPAGHYAEPKTSDHKATESVAAAIAAPFKAAWEVDAFQWPATVLDLLGSQESAFEEISGYLQRANRQGLKVVQITAAERGVGRSTTAMCLAAAMAHAGLKVALVDGDIENPSLATQLNLELEFSWPQCITDNVPLAEVAVYAVEEEVTLFPLLLPWGREAAEGLRSRINRLLRRISNSFDLVIIDAHRVNQQWHHAIGCGEDAAVDAALVVVDAELSVGSRVESTLELLRHSDIASIGVVENFRADVTP